MSKTLIRIRDLRDESPMTGSGVDLCLSNIEQQLVNFNFDFTPIYQRDHVWDEAQRALFVGNVLRGVRVPPAFVTQPRDIGDESYRIVDGKQRLTSLLMWSRGEISANVNGRLIHIDDTDRKFGMTHAIRVDFVRFSRLSQEMRFYLALNAGGTPHAKADIARVEALYAAELEREAAAA